MHSFQSYYVIQQLCFGMLWLLETLDQGTLEERLHLHYLCKFGLDGSEIRQISIHARLLRSKWVF